MAAPVPTPRLTPTAKKFDDGFKTLITFATNPSIEFWEKTVKPPGVDGGDAVDSTTMHSNVWRTRGPRKLKTLTDLTTTAVYNPSLYVSILGLINVQTTVTVTFPDLSTLAFFGFLRNFEPAELSEGNDVTCTITVTPTNSDPVSGAEAAPVYTAPPVGGGAPMAPVAPELRPSGAPPEVPEGVDFASTYAREQPAPPTAPAPEAAPGPQPVTQEAR